MGIRTVSLCKQEEGGGIRETGESVDGGLGSTERWPPLLRFLHELHVRMMRVRLRGKCSSANVLGLTDKFQLRLPATTARAFQLPMHQKERFRKQNRTSRTAVYRRDGQRTLRR